MTFKLQHRIHTTADRKMAYEASNEAELRRRLQLIGAYGVMSADGKDVDSDAAACAVVTDFNSSTFSVSAGTVVFPNGEYVDVVSGDISGISVSPSAVDSQLVRLEYGEVASEDKEANPFYSFSASPSVRNRTPLEMLVVESVSSYNAQSSAVKALSVVLGVINVESGLLVADNGRDTYTYSRPWFTPTDTQHRSMVGNGLVTSTNPHGTSPENLTYKNFTLWEVMAGPPSAVLSKSASVSRVAGALCTETIPAGSFTVDTTGRVTGLAGCAYAHIGFWPEKLLRANLFSSPTTEVAAWVPRGRNIVAVYDPVSFALPADLVVYYTKVEAGALPGSLAGNNVIDMGQPTATELLVAGGSVLSELSDPRVYFTDVGLIPMSFDILVGSDGKVYKRPDVIYCNTKLDTIGAGSVVITSQPRVATRIRVAISNYIPSLTEVRIQITGVDSDGAPAVEQVAFTGPLPAVSTSYTEAAAQRKFTDTVFASVTNIQVLTRNGDGPNTTLSMFAEHVPEDVEITDDLLLASVHWTGVEVTTDYATGSGAALDRRIVSRGGPNRGLSPAGSFFMTGSGEFSTSELTSATIVEDFADPMWVMSPRSDTSPVVLPGNSIGARMSYMSRKIPFVRELNPATLVMRLIPRGQHFFPSLPRDLSIVVTTYNSNGSTSTYVSSNTDAWSFSPYPPFDVKLNLVAGSVSNCFAVKVRFEDASGQPINEVIQGFVLHARGNAQ